MFVIDNHKKLNGSYSVPCHAEGHGKQEGASEEAVPGKISVLIEAAL